MKHGSERNRQFVSEHLGTYVYTRVERFCVRCGWVTVNGVTGELKWMAEHDEHRPVVGLSSP